MNVDPEKGYSYSYLFAVTLVFSSLATEVFILYLSFRGSVWATLDIIVGLILVLLFSALGQKISKVKELGGWIFGVSTVSSGVYYNLFALSTIPHLLPTVAIFPLLAWMGYVAWDMLGSGWEYIGKMKVSKKPVILVAAIAIGILATFFVSIYSIEIMSFLDSHPWIMTLIGVLIGIGGIIFGRRTKKG